MLSGILLAVAATAVLGAYLRQTGAKSVRERRYYELAERIAAEGDVSTQD